MYFVFLNFVKNTPSIQIFEKTSKVENIRWIGHIVYIQTYIIFLLLIKYWKNKSFHLKLQIIFFFLNKISKHIFFYNWNLSLTKKVIVQKHSFPKFSVIDSKLIFSRKNTFGSMSVWERSNLKKDSFTRVRVTIYLFIFSILQAHNKMGRGWAKPFLSFL